jgi:hypothetical protein
VKGFYYRQQNQTVELKEADQIETNNNSSDLVVNEVLIPIEENIGDVNAEVLNKSIDKKQIISREKELELMKAAEVKKLCTNYSINYQNKQKAITAILEFESLKPEVLTESELVTEEDLW